MDPFRQRSHEGMPPALHDDDKQGNHGRAHAHAQGEQDAPVFPALPVGIVSESLLFLFGLLSDLFGDVFPQSFPFAVEFRPVAFEARFILLGCGFAVEDAPTMLFLFCAIVFPPFGFFEQPARLVEFGELFPERPIR